MSLGRGHWERVIEGGVYNFKKGRSQTASLQVTFEQNLKEMRDRRQR